MNTADKINKQLDLLWAKFLPQMHSRINAIQRAIDAWHDNASSPYLRKEAAEAAHKLAGSLGTFGLNPASDDAVQVERLLSAEFYSEETRALLEDHFARIKKAIESRSRNS